MNKWFQIEPLRVGVDSGRNPFWLFKEGHFGIINLVSARTKTAYIKQVVSYLHRLYSKNLNPSKFLGLSL